LLTEGSSPDPRTDSSTAQSAIFEGSCRKRVTEKDDLSLLDGLGITDRAKLNAKGIFTVTQLAYTFRPRRGPSIWPRSEKKYHHALKAWQFETRRFHVVGTPELALIGSRSILMSRPAGSCFYYLIGLRIPDGPSFLQYSLWLMNPVTSTGSGDPSLIYCGH